MVGYRNLNAMSEECRRDFIRHSDGGYRNEVDPQPRSRLDFIRHSDGGSAATALRVDLLRGSHALRWIEGACHVR